MTSKKFLSNKKTSQQTISISPALQEWIKRYVNTMNKKNPNDPRYKSVSSFYTDVMEKVLTIFDKGKTLNDLEKVPDTEIKDFYDKLTFKAVIPYFEQAILMNKYSSLDFRVIPQMFLRYRNFILRENELTDADLQQTMERFKQYMTTNKITKDFKIDIVNSKYIIEYAGYYENLQFDFSKGIAGILGTIGLKIVDFFYSKEEKYSRFDCIKTPLFTTKDSELKERKILFNYNMSQIINYYRIVNDNNYYLWSEMANDKDISLNFKNQKSRDYWVNTIIDHIKKFSPKDEFLLSLLKFFENLHWIAIENEKNLSFQFKLPFETFNKEKQFLLEIIEKFAKIKEINDVFYLE